MAPEPDLKRRGFLFGRPQVAAPLRPPWALAESEFLDRCTRCNACVERCPGKVLSTGAGRYPIFDPQLGECTFCGACVDACPSHALDRGGAPWDLVAIVGDACLPKSGVVCSSCRDICPEQAVRFPLSTSIPQPIVDNEKCTGCGACVSTCPTGALTLHRKQREPA